MGFRELNIKSEYRSLSDNVVKDFYIPTLQKAIIYKRAVGFFTSSALIEISRGLTGLIKNGGHIRLIVSPKLQEEDIHAITKGYKKRNHVIERAILNAITEPRDYFEEERLNLLANLVADGHLDIKIAFTEWNTNIGIYHEKMGLMYDNKNNIIAFTGSMNESSTAFTHNYETIDVFCSWTDDNTRVKAKEAAFDTLWNDSEPNVNIVEFPRVAIDKLKTFKKESINMDIDELQYSSDSSNIPSIGPLIPKDVYLYDYQLGAIEQWIQQGFCGIFDMATGTGKTYTALGALAELYNHCDGELFIIIVCPYQHLVEQWLEDIYKFNMKPIIGYSASNQKNWKKRLKNAVIDFNLGIKNHFCFITTNATFSSKYVSEKIDMLKGNVALVIDEAHNFGAKNLSNTLNPKVPYRLALSATLERHGDEEGTKKLYEYFGEKCIEYSLKRAIQEDKLTPYYYYPVVVYLNDDELSEYRALTKEIIKHYKFNNNSKPKISEQGKILLIKRARIIAAAQEKIAKLNELMINHKEDRHILVYCGATTIRDPKYVEGDVDEFEMRQIDVVSDLLGNKLDMKIAQFTSAENREKRELLKKEFSEGKHIQSLIAIRCLDEGVNIPSIKTAFILASSTNPKEYIQRRGRVLRKFPGKHHAVIYDFITLPRPLNMASVSSKDELKMDLSLINREINRMKDFASIAENPMETDHIILQIEDTYGLTKIGGEEFD